MQNLISIFTFDTPYWDLFLRGTLMYFFLFLLIQLVNRKQAGKLSSSNFLLIVVLADISQNAFVGNYNSLTSGIFLVLTVFFWSVMLNWLGYRFPFIQRLISPPPRLLVHNGEIDWANMRRSLVTYDELTEQMRLEGIKNLNEIEKAYIESDGDLSFILHEEKPRKLRTD